MKKIHIVLLIIIILLGVSLFVNLGFVDIFNGFSLNDGNDSKFIDRGTSKNCSNDWYMLPNVTKTVLNNGTLIKSDGDEGIYANKPNTEGHIWNALYDWTSPFVVEFDVLEWSGTPYIRITNETIDCSKGFEELGIHNGSHVKIVSSTENVTYIIDGNSYTPFNQSLKNAQIGFRLVNASLIYQNYTIY